MLINFSLKVNQSVELKILNRYRKILISPKALINSSNLQSVVCAYVLSLSPDTPFPGGAGLGAQVAPAAENLVKAV